MCEIGALMFRLYRGKEHFSVAFGGETLISDQVCLPLNSIVKLKVHVPGVL